MKCDFLPIELTIGGEIIKIERPQVLGILNVTPDSFYKESRCDEELSIARRVEEIISQGGDIIDIGAYSTRPDASFVTVEEEISRLDRALKILRKQVGDVVVSVDTFRADVARFCVENYGAQIINDVSGGTLDDKMFGTVAQLNVPYILMHMRGTPQTMQSFCEYENVTNDVVADLLHKAKLLKDLGVNDVILDPGFGFSKTLEQNYEMISRLGEFVKTGFPILVGISRKSMIYKALGIKPQESLNGTTVLNTVALLNGAHFLRVHDVEAAVEVVNMIEKLRN